MACENGSSAKKKRIKRRRRRRYIHSNQPERYQILFSNDFYVELRTLSIHDLFNYQKNKNIFSLTMKLGAALQKQTQRLRWGKKESIEKFSNMQYFPIIADTLQICARVTRLLFLSFFLFLDFLVIEFVQR